jgi:dGTPase
MMRTRAELEELEHQRLAAYGQKSGESAGREHPEPHHPFRTEYERDRARIIHCRAFRRLEYKTQVFLNGTGDHLRTRLTHTMEVASISRTIARALGLNEDLAEAIALAHDLGHSPFGHCGERALNAMMQDQGGFEHNVQSLRIVELIEQKYPRFPGLNLSWEVREGLHKHAKFYDPPEALKEGAKFLHPSLEAQIANLADEITYYSHDLDDGLDFDMLDPAQLAGLEVWQHSLEAVLRHFPSLRGKQLHGYVIRCIIDRQVQDVIETSTAAIQASGVSSVEEVRRHKEPLICYSSSLLSANKKLRQFLFKNLYDHPTVAEVNQTACQTLQLVFETYLAEPDLLGEMTARRLEKEGLHRTVCDYLSGMTDRYVLEEHARLVARNNASLNPSLLSASRRHE